MDIHDGIQSEIQEFLNRQAVISLRADAQAASGESIIKAGVVPFTRGNDYRYFMMKPVAKRPGLGAPAFQICKGTRMRRATGHGWIDMRDDTPATGEKETLAVTALREGIEELGLILGNIRQIIDVGPYDFSSAKTGKSRQMWLFALEMLSETDVLPMSGVAPTTAERGWLSLEQFSVVGREDHRYILDDIAARLKAYHS